VAPGDIVPVPGARFEETLASASPDLLREMIKGFAQRMMDADVEARCNAGYGEVTPERVNSRNGYRRREWDTRAGTEPVALSCAPSAGVRSHALLASAMRAVG
jgi:putative transposase